MASMALESDPKGPPKNLTAMISTFGATPTTLLPSEEAAMVPATWVPWKSSRVSWMVLSSLAKS